MILPPTVVRIAMPIVTAAVVLAVNAAAAQEPLRIQKQGSIEAGGELVHCATNDGGDPKSERWPAGRVMINHVYATYQYPADQRYRYPILFNPGGGHSARVYDTTPDGREGWLTLFPRAGFAVYGVDRVNTGRAGGDICKINAVRLGGTPIAAMPAINRYSAESAWVTFRWGPTKLRRVGPTTRRSRCPPASARSAMFGWPGAMRTGTPCAGISTSLLPANARSCSSPASPGSARPPSPRLLPSMLTRGAPRCCWVAVRRTPVCPTDPGSKRWATSSPTLPSPSSTASGLACWLTWPGSSPT